MTHDKPTTNTRETDCDLRRRTPQEVAEQLERDATSLTLTGASFDKDKAFYEAVAANVREAAQWLAAWQTTMDATSRAMRAHGIERGYAATSAALATAERIRDAMTTWDGACTHWHAGAEAVCSALRARFESHPRPAGETKRVAAPVSGFALGAATEFATKGRGVNEVRS